MIIGVLTVFLHFPLCHSLKEKRRHLNSLKARLASSYNVSVAEVDEQDKWQAGVLAVVHAGVSRPVVDSVLSRIVALLEDANTIQVVNYETELIT